MEWIKEETEKNESTNKIFSFDDYIEYFNEFPKRELRPSFKYLIDMLEYFGKEEDGKLKLFEKEDSDSPPVFGQHIPEREIYKNLENFLEEGYNNKFILLVGPNGSSKSSIVRKLMKGAEDYSETEEGSLFSFSWIFPIDNFVKGSLGLSSSQEMRSLKTFAHLEDKDISAILPSELKDHPILLIPIAHRQKLIEDKLAGDPERLEMLKKSYLYRGDISKRNRMIYDALLKNYKGDHSAVLKHIRIERFNISRRYSVGAATIEPQLHVDARMQQITMDKRLASLPPSLQSLNLFSLQGEAVMANRGILEFSDLLKRPLDAYKYLLMTMETKNINLQGILTELDIFFIGTSNEIHLAAFKQHPDYNSFKGRFNFVKVPYLLDYASEEKIYSEQIEGLKDKSSFEPHAISTLCKFAVLTRLRQGQSSNYVDKKLGNICVSLNPLEKAELLSKGLIPKKLDTESKQILKQGIQLIREEYLTDPLYEGKFGISPREIKRIIYDLTSENSNISYVEVIEYLEKLILRKNDHDFLNMTAQGDYHHPARFLTLLKSAAAEDFDRELRDSLGLVDNRSYEDYLQKYISHINSLIKGEKVKNAVTGKYEVSDDYFIKEFETSINLKEKPETFRSQLIAKLGAYSLDNPGKPIVYSEVFKDVIELLKESFRKEQKKFIQKISKNLVFYEAEVTHKDDTEKGQVTTPLSEQDRKDIKTVIDNLMSKYGYSHNGALTLLKSTIKEKY